VFGAGKVKAIPIAIEGFSGETLALLKFDLFVQGFEFVDKAKAQFTIKNNGSTASSVRGAVYDRVKKGNILTRSYKGGSLRQQAHTFANNTVEAITGSPGIGLTRIAFKQYQFRAEPIVLSIKGKRGAKAPTPATIDSAKAASKKIIKSDIIRVPTAEEMKRGAKIEVIKAEDLPQK